MNSLHLYLNSTHEQTHQPVFRDMRTNKQTDRCGHILLICRLTLPGYICSLGFVHIFISRTDYLLDTGSISPFFLKKKKSHSCIYGSVINLADRCLLRRYKQPNNRVCLGCDDSRCAVQKKTQQVFTKNESEWNQQFTALYSAAAADRQRREILLFLSCFVSAAAEACWEGTSRFNPAILVSCQCFPFFARITHAATLTCFRAGHVQFIAFKINIF